MQNGSDPVIRIDTPQGHEIVMRQSQALSEDAEAVFDEIRVESVMACGYGGMRGKNSTQSYAPVSAVKRDLIVLHNPAGLFKDGKGAVPLI